MTSLGVRASALRDRPGYGELLAALRTRLEAGGDPSTVTLSGLSAEARRALADLLGRRRPPGATTRVRLDELDAALRASRVGAGLREVLEAAGGPLADHRGQRAGARAAWSAVWDIDHPVLDRPEVAAWLERLRHHGTLRRLTADPDEATVLLADALAVVDRLPERAVPLSVLAAEAAGDPHALDHRRPLATLVLRAAAAMAGTDVPPSARGRRQLWADVGVVCDPLSVSVLVLGLRLDDDDVIARACAEHASAAIPLRLTLHQLARAATLRAGQRRVLVCENPAVVAAAAARLAETRGKAAHPLVCVEGMPDVAADRLLSGLAEGGATLAFHADFDWGGLRIGSLLHRRYGAVPWRFGAHDYRSALAAGRSGGALRGRPGTAAWDPELAAVMRRTGVAVAEEQLLDTLLADLVEP